MTIAQTVSPHCLPGNEASVLPVPSKRHALAQRQGDLYIPFSLFVGIVVEEEEKR